MNHFSMILRKSFLLSVEKPFNPTELSNRSNLVEILAAFAPSDYFKKKENMKQCLEYLPPQKLRSLSGIF